MKKLINDVETVLAESLDGFAAAHADIVTLGMVDGVTTNPSLIAKSGRNFIEVVKEICEIVPGPVSAEVTAVQFDGMLAEGRKLARIAAVASALLSGSAT